MLVTKPPPRIVEALGGEVILVDIVPGHSTTSKGRMDARTEDALVLAKDYAWLHGVRS